MNNNIYQKLIRELDDLTMELKVLRCDIEHMHEYSEKQTQEKRKYQQAYNLLMTYWDSLPDDEKEYIDKRLGDLDL